MEKQVLARRMLLRLSNTLLAVASCDFWGGWHAGHAQAVYSVGCGDWQQAPCSGCCCCCCWDAAATRKERTCQVVSFQLWGSGELERLSIHWLQSNSRTDEILNTRLGGPQPRLMPCIFNGETRVSMQRSSARSAATAHCSHPSKQRGPWGIARLQSCCCCCCRCPRSRIFCLFDLLLTFAVAAGKADPIDFMWIMIFCRLPWNLLIVHTAIYSVSEWDSEISDGVRGYLHTLPWSWHFCIFS